MHKNYLYVKKIFLLFSFIILVFYSCAPKIQFIVVPPTISKGDSVFMNWKIKGQPTLMFDQRKIAHPPNDSLEILEFTLSVEKNGKVKYIKRQVSVLPAESSDKVTFSITGLQGDTLIADGTKDTLLWKNYEIISLSTVTGRPLIISHAGTVAEIKEPAVPSGTWKDKPYAGYWKIMSILTEAEEKDNTIIPNSLEIQAVIRPTKK